MSNLEKIPLEDWFETSLAQEWDGQIGSVFVNNTPNFTFPSGVTTYIVVNPTKTNFQVAEIDSYDAVAGTLNVIDIALEKWASINSTTQTHAVNSKVIISDNYEFWKQIRTTINSKMDNDGGNTTTTFDLQVSGSSFRVRLDSGDMKFTDDNNAEVSLSTLTAAAGVDKKVTVSINDTTAGTLTDKLNFWDWLSSSISNPSWNESIDVSVNINDTNIHATESDFWLSKQSSISDSLSWNWTNTYVTPAWLWVAINPLFTEITNSNSVNNSETFSSTFTVTGKTVCEFYNYSTNNGGGSSWPRSSSIQVEISSVWTDVKVISASWINVWSGAYIYTLQPWYNYRIRNTNTSTVSTTTNDSTLRYQEIV